MTTRPLLAAAVLAALFAAPLPAQSQTYPDRPVRIVIAFNAGGTIDVLGRMLAHKLTEVWGQSVVVENRGGGGGNIGAVAASQAAPDGYTLHFGAQSLAVNVTLSPVANFDPSRDFEPIMLVASSQDILLVGPQSPFKSVTELVDHARANPGKLTYGTINIASSSHLAMWTFSNATGVKLQMVPYSLSAQMSNDVMTGRVDMQFPTTGGHIGNVTSGKLRALAVSGPSRAKVLPDIPTLRELGIAFDDEASWYALYAPKGTPKAIIDKINRDMETVLAMPDLKQRETQLGFRFIGGPPERLAAHLRKETDKWAKVVKTPAFLGK